MCLYPNIFSESTDDVSTEERHRDYLTLERRGGNRVPELVESKAMLEKRQYELQEPADVCKDSVGQHW